MLFFISQNLAAFSMVMNNWYILYAYIIFLVLLKENILNHQTSSIQNFLLVINVKQLNKLNIGLNCNLE